MSTLRDIAREYKLSWEALQNLDSDDPGYEAANLRWEEALRAYQSTPESWSARAAFTLDSLDCEVRQTRRQMIAALYYRAGLAELESRRPLQSIHMEARQRGGAAWLLNTARAMEAEASHG